MTEGGEMPVDEAATAVRAHRRDVVQRLLARGLSVTALEVMLPGWSRLAR